MDIQIINSSKAIELFKSLSNEFVVIKNPEFVHPEFEIVPLAKKIYKPDSLLAFVMDMDGTTTTTEELCIESLEFMIRKMSGLLTKEQWQGLNHQKDYPNIIGNSTTKHIEYLINNYKSLINKSYTIHSFIDSINWTLKTGKSEQRKNEVKDLLKSFGFSYPFEYLSSNISTTKDINSDLLNFLENRLNMDNPSELVKIGIEIYYHHYHQYLKNLDNTNEHNSETKKLIQPMPGVSIFLALTKGLLGNEAKNLSEILIEDFNRKNPYIKLDLTFQDIETKLEIIGNYFEKNPVKIAIVTSSISYEADIVLNEIFRQMKNEILNWNISEKRRTKILEKFSSYGNFYDAIVTATDAYEFRLKPHRDLYSIALYRLGISLNDFDKVIGFEDSQSGTIAIRAAGIGCSIAVPFPHTKGHNLEAASYILWNGLPEFILKHNCLINENLYGKK